jgi:hypothetical protein
MPDGKRKRRHDVNRARRQWYAQHRARRFLRRFGLVVNHIGRTLNTSIETTPTGF